MSATTTVTGSVCDREQGGDFLSEVEVREIAVGLEEGEASYSFIFITTELGATKKAEPRGRLRPYACATSCAASHFPDTDRAQGDEGHDDLVVHPPSSGHFWQLCNTEPPAGPMS